MGKPGQATYSIQPVFHVYLGGQSSVPVRHLSRLSVSIFILQNDNILQAALCLVKELDGDGLEAVVAACRERMEVV